jgi:hypothetical protein
MLAARRSFRIGEETIRTPLLVPSYSSRAGGQAVTEIIKVTREFVSGVVLVSAYDIQRNGLKQSDLQFATHVFLDSGGYEAGADADLSEVVSPSTRPDNWRIKEHGEVLKKWKFEQPTVLVNYDAPDKRINFDSQIRRANRQREKYKSAAHVFLAKPEPKAASAQRYYVSIPDIIRIRHHRND